ncbi:MAG: prepilin-type N-terminal cleavage/methylation domain-containing protein [Acidimicrobiales bacterium]
MGTYQRLKRRRKAGEIDGFTLIEILIVIVVLGILAAVVIFALGGFTSKSAIGACQADGATVAEAISVFNNQNPSTTVSQALLTGSTDGGPYISSWPSNDPHYAYAIVGGVLGIEVPGPSTGAWTPASLSTTLASGEPYVGPWLCSGVV